MSRKEEIVGETEGSLRGVKGEEFNGFFEGTEFLSVFFPNFFSLGVGFRNPPKFRIGRQDE